MKSFVVLAALAALAVSLPACSSSSSSPPPAPSGVFVRTDGSTSAKIWLAFDNGKGARKSVQSTPSGADVIGKTCFTYEANGAAVKMTLKKISSTSNGATTSSDPGGRIVETTATMTSDGSKLDANNVLEDGRFEYTHDAATSASDVMDGC